MIEFVKLIVDMVAKAVPGIVSRSERDKSAQLGAELFLLYVQLNEVLVRAEKITTMLERYDPEAGRDNYWTRQALLELVPDQIADLRASAARLQDLNWELQVLDGRSYGALRFLLDLKMSALDVLAYAITVDHLPLGTTSIVIDDAGIQSLPTMMSLRSFQSLSSELYNELGLDNPTRSDEARRIRAYLEQRHPRDELEAIRENLERLRDAIGEHFTIEDILLRAGDPRVIRKRRR